MSPTAQQQHADVSGPSLSEIASLNTFTSPVEGESTSPVNTTTIEVPVLDDAQVHIRRKSLPSNVSSDSDDEIIENIDTITDPRIVTLPSAIHGEPSQVPDRHPSTIQGEPLQTAQENSILIPTNPDDSAGCSQV